MPRLALILFYLGCLIALHTHVSFGQAAGVIKEKDDNVPLEMKVGIAQEFKHPSCARKVHAKTPLPVREDAEYDFIIVGGGSAGNAMAARLTENSNVKVLLLESGKNFIDNADEVNRALEGIFKVPYCNPLEPQNSADKCPLLSLPAHFAETPFMSPYMSMTNDSYYYVTIPQVYANKREINYPRGNLLGGSSATNTMIPFRGHPEDFDKWASLGLEGWSYKNILPFYKKVETNHDFGHETDYHGNDGPIHITNVSSHFKFPVFDAILDTALKMGYPKVEDFMNPKTIYGAGYWQQFVNDKGRRTSSYEYIRRAIQQGRVCIDGLIAEISDQDETLKMPATYKNKDKCTDKQNLHIQTAKFATKILFDEFSGDASENLEKDSGKKRRAIGVEYTSHDKHHYRAVRPYPTKQTEEEAKSRWTVEYWKTNQRSEQMNCPVEESLAWDYNRGSEWYIPPFNEKKDLPAEDIQRVYAKREVILSAGAVNTAQLLMLSGVGPREHLKRQLGMKDKEIVMDLPVGSRTLDHEELTMNFKLPTGVRHWNILTDLLGETNKWVKGEPSALGANHAPGGMDISSDGPNGTEPTIHIHALMLYFENLDHHHWKNQDSRRVPRGMSEFATYKGLDYFTFLIERTGGCSEGSLRLRNRDPFNPPFIDMNYGSCQFSNEEILFGIKEMRRLNSLMPEKYRGEEVMPGKEVDTDEKLLEYIRNMIWGHHISGTVPMGACDDNKAVLDNHGRVYGVSGLRVADASAFPTIPSGNILYTTYMVAERIADFILSDNGLKNRDKPINLNQK